MSRICSPSQNLGSEFVDEFDAYEIATAVVRQVRDLVRTPVTETSDAAAFDSASPWLAVSLKRIGELQQLCEIWGDPNIAPPNATAAENALAVLEKLVKVSNG